MSWGKGAPWQEADIQESSRETRFQVPDDIAELWSQIIPETHPTSDFLLAELRNLLNYLFGVCMYVLVQAHDTAYTEGSEDHQPKKSSLVLKSSKSSSVSCNKTSPDVPVSDLFLPG